MRLQGTRFLAAALAACAVMAGAAAAQDKYPSKPIKLIVPFAPGGQTDITARVVSNHIAQTVGQPLIIENRGGAGGSLGSELASKAPPDGYTLLLATSSTHSTNPWIYPKLAYHPVNSFTPIAHITVAPMALAVHTSKPVHTVAELVALTKQNPGKLNYGSSGVGSLNHIMGALFNLWAGIDTVHVPYAGAGPEMADLMAGVLDMDWNALAVLSGGAKTGQIRIIATTMNRRARSFPDLPTVAEAGYPKMNAFSWTVLFGPAGTPQEVVQTLSKAVNAALADKTVSGRLAEIGAEPMTETTPEQTAAFVKAEYERWGPLVKLSGARVE
ncbi:MAG: Bug family tripartite tricarboxylate transporter substrate binding protein [Acetobacteraceae bacterium]